MSRKSADRYRNMHMHTLARVHTNCLAELMRYSYGPQTIRSGSQIRTLHRFFIAIAGPEATLLIYHES